MGDSKNPEIWKAVAMADHFEKIQKLPDKVEGVPNFRRVPGYKVFCCGQPTKEGFVKAIEKACGDKWPKDGPIVWLNMRQEAIVYINGNPVCARPPGKIGEYAELGNVTRKFVYISLVILLLLFVYVQRRLADEKFVNTTSLKVPCF